MDQRNAILGRKHEFWSSRFKAAHCGNKAEGLLKNIQNPVCQGMWREGEMPEPLYSRSLGQQVERWMAKGCLKALIGSTALNFNYRHQITKSSNIL